LCEKWKNDQLAYTHTTQHNTNRKPNHNNKTKKVLVALDLSRATYRRIRANFAWALGYNAIMIPVAAGASYPWARVQLPPWVAGGCMVASSVSVVLSSLSLRRYRPPARPAGAALGSVRVE
jgi:hypothetical protein